MLDVLIIGAGVVGSFIARSLSRYKLDVLVLEKENDVGNVTSMANSAICHSGYDPLPGSKKAKFNVLGNRMMKKVCEELDAPFLECGSLTIALEEEQMSLLKELKNRGKMNGVPSEILTKEEIQRMEPNINPEVKGALFCKTAALISPFDLTAHAMENACDNGVKLHLGEEVTSIIPLERGGFLCQSNQGNYETKLLINAAGLHSDDIAKMIEPISWRILPRKGEYFVLDHYAKGLVNHVLFPLPSEKGKGILVTMTTSGNYLVGPSSERQNDKEDFSTDAMTLNHVRKEATHLVPNIPFNQQIRVFAGLRATPSTHDFIIEPSQKYPHFINVAGIESPGLASSPAIGEYVAKEIVGRILSLKEKENYNPCVRPYPKLKNKSVEERNKLIRENKEYGHIICDCEKISVGEIMDVLSRSVPVRTIKGIKKRTRAGFGKCQGGFCQPKIISLLAKKWNVSPLEVLYDKDGSEILEYEAKPEKER
ncbi:MAG TPA: FAD/NAD(P)-binding oxidoreductase [Firmicutes bacterium]|nr:FAD/NAD(P)-binding oxidoreductase [Bacillota bacterium]